MCKSIFLRPGDSPRTGGFGYAYSVDSGGYVDSIDGYGGVTHSYGKIRSPYTGYTYGASFVKQDGDPHSSLVSTLVSYGCRYCSPVTRYGIGSYYVYSDGIVLSSTGVGNSYG